MKSQWEDCFIDYFLWFGWRYFYISMSSSIRWIVEFAMNLKARGVIWRGWSRSFYWQKFSRGKFCPLQRVVDWRLINFSSRYLFVKLLKMENGKIWKIVTIPPIFRWNTLYTVIIQLQLFVSLWGIWECKNTRNINLLRYLQYNLFFHRIYLINKMLLNHKITKLQNCSHK